MPDGPRYIDAPAVDLDQVKGKVAPTIIGFNRGSYGGYRVSWENMQSGDVGQWVHYPDYDEKTVSVEGEVKDGGLQGTNHSNVLPYDDAVSPQELLCERNQSFKEPGMYRLKMNPLYIRPIVRKGKNVTFTMIVAR